MPQGREGDYLSDDELSRWLRRRRGTQRPEDTLDATPGEDRKDGPDQDEDGQRRLQDIAVQNAARRRRDMESRSSRARETLMAPPERPAPGTAIVRAGVPVPVPTNYGRSQVPIGQERGLRPVTEAIPSPDTAPYYGPAAERVEPRRESVVERVLRKTAPRGESWEPDDDAGLIKRAALFPMRQGARVIGAAQRGLADVAESFADDSPMKAVDRALSMPFRAGVRTAEGTGKAVGFVGDMGVQIAKEHPVETAMFSNPLTAPAAAVALGIQGAYSAGGKLRAKVEGRGYKGEVDEYGIERVPTAADIAPDLLMTGFAGLEAGRFARQIMKGKDASKGVVDRVLGKMGANREMDVRFGRAQERQAKEKVALPLLAQEKEAAELASAQRASRQRAPKLLNSGGVVTPPPGVAGAPERELESLLAELRRARGGAEAPAPARPDPFNTTEAEVISIEPQRSLPAGRYDMPGATFQTRDVPETRPDRLLPNIRGTDQYPRAASPASAVSGEFTEGPGIPGRPVRPPQGIPERATEADIDTYRAARDEGAPPIRRRQSATGNFRTGEAPGALESVDEYRARLRRLLERRAERAPVGELDDFFERQGKGLTEARNLDGSPKRNVTDIPDDEIDAELLKVAEQDSHEQGLIAHRDDPRWQQYLDMPKEEKTGIRRITDEERVGGIENLKGKKPRKNQKTRKMEDLPEGGGLYDPDELDEIRRMDAEYEQGTLSRQSRDAWRRRLEAEKEARRIKREGGEPKGSADLDLVAPIGGSVTGAVAGGLTGDTAEERLRNMAIGAAGGAGIGAITARVLGDAPSIAARGGVTRGQRGGYVGEPKRMMGSQDFPKPLPESYVARQRAIEMEAEARKRGKITLPTERPGTQSPVLKGEELLAESGEGSTVLSGSRRAGVEKSADVARGNRVGAVGDLSEKGSGSPMRRAERAPKAPGPLSADELNALTDEQMDLLDEELRAGMDAGHARDGGRRNYEGEDAATALITDLRSRRGKISGDLAVEMREVAAREGWDNDQVEQLLDAIQDDFGAVRKAVGVVDGGAARAAETIGEVPNAGVPGALIASPVSGEVGGAAVGGTVGALGDEDDTAGERVVKALAGAALGVAGVKAAKAMGKRSPKEVGPGYVKTQPVARTEAAMRAERTAKRTASAEERIREPVAPYPKNVDPAAAARSAKKPPSVEDILGDIRKRYTGDNASLEKEIRESTQQMIDAGKVPAKIKVTHETERALADRLGIDAADLATRDPSRKLSASEMLKLADGKVEIAQRKMQLRNILASPSTNEFEKASAESLLDVLQRRSEKIVARISRDRSQSGRDLNALKMMAKQSDDPDDWIREAQEMLGQQRLMTAQEKAEFVGAIDQRDFAKATRKLAEFRKSTAAEKFSTLYRTGLLSALSRPIRDVLSNVANVGVRHQAEQVISSVADKFGSLLTGVRTTDYGMASAKAAFEGAKRGAREAAAIMGESIPALKKFGGGEDGRAALQSAMERHDFLRETNFDTPLIDWATKLVTRSLGAADAFMFRAAEAGSRQSFAQAIAKTKAQAQKIPAAERAAFIERETAALLKNPSSEMLMRSKEAATEAVWQNQTLLAQGGSAIQKLPFAGPMILPFSRTPGAMAMDVVRSTPLGLLEAIPDVVNIMKKRNVPEAQRALVKKLGKVSVGSALMFAGYTLADEDGATAWYPTDTAERNQWKQDGRIENAIKVDAKWVALPVLLGPAGMLMSMGVYMRRLMEDEGKSLAASIAQGSTAGAAEAVLSSPMMTSISALDEARRRGDEAPEQLASAFAGSFVPQIVQRIARGMDTDADGRQVIRDAKGEGFMESVTNALKAGIPGLREDLPEKVSSMGKTRTGSGGGVLSNVNPLRSSVDQAERDPVLKELRRLGVGVGEQQRLPDEDRAAYAKRASLESTEVNEVLSRVIASPDYTQWPPPEWVQRAVENSSVWDDKTDKRTPQEKAQDALLRYMIRYVRTRQGKRGEDMYLDTSSEDSTPWEKLDSPTKYKFRLDANTKRYERPE